MKRTLLSLMVILGFTVAASAQGFHVGAKLGANFSKIDGQTFKDGFELGYHVGGFAEIDFNEHIGIQPEVLFNQTNTKVTDDPNDVFSPGKKIKLNYLSIPVLLRINAGKILTFNVGPQFGILMNNEQTLLQNGKDAFKSGDFGMVAGAQVNVGALRVYGRYNVGLSKVNDVVDQEKWKNQAIQLGVGFRIL